VLFDTTPRVSGRSTWAKLAALGRRLDSEAEYAKIRDKVTELVRSAGQAKKYLITRIRELVRIGELAHLPKRVS
jgi:hypothetical protein